MFEKHYRKANNAIKASKKQKEDLMMQIRSGGKRTFWGLPPKAVYTTAICLIIVLIAALLIPQIPKQTLPTDQHKPSESFSLEGTASGNNPEPPTGGYTDPTEPSQDGQTLFPNPGPSEPAPPSPSMSTDSDDPEPPTQIPDLPPTGPPQPPPTDPGPVPTDPPQPPPTDPNPGPDPTDPWDPPTDCSTEVPPTDPTEPTEATQPPTEATSPTEATYVIPKPRWFQVGRQG